MLKAGEIKGTLKEWFKLRDQNNYYIRYGRDPGEEALNEENRLLNLIYTFALSSDT